MIIISIIFVNLPFQNYPHLSYASTLLHRYALYRSSFRLYRTVKGIAAEPVFVVALLAACEVEAEASVVASSVTPNILSLLLKSSFLRHYPYGARGLDYQAIMDS